MDPNTITLAQLGIFFMGTAVVWAYTGIQIKRNY